MMRPSAGTWSPAASSTTSPTTSSSAGISASAPSRRTRAVAFIIDLSAFIALSALPSWRRPTDGVHQGQHQQQDGGAPLLDQQGDDGRDEQDDLHVAAVLVEEPPPARLGLLLRQGVRAVGVQQLAGPRRGQAGGGIHLQRRDDLGGGAGVPRAGGRRPVRAVLALTVMAPPSDPTTVPGRGAPDPGLWAPKRPGSGAARVRRSADVQRAAAVLAWACSRGSPVRVAPTHTHQGRFLLGGPRPGGERHGPS